MVLPQGTSDSWWLWSWILRLVIPSTWSNDCTVFYSPTTCFHRQIFHLSADSNFWNHFNFKMFQGKLNAQLKILTMASISYLLRCSDGYEWNNEPTKTFHEKSIIFSTDVKPGRDDWFNLRNSYTVYSQQTYFHKYEERLFR